MEISEFEIEISDIDWFAIDSVGEIAHFTSGAYGGLPKSVSKSRLDLNFLTEFFTEKIEKSTIGEVDPKAFDRVILVSGTPEDGQVVFCENLEMSSQGLYSYDSYDALVNSGAYFRVSLPLQPIRVEMLPKEIQNVLNRTVLKDIIFKKDSIISEQSIASC